MKMKKIKYSLLIIIAATSFVACEKEDIQEADEPIETKQMSINISNPTEGATFDFGEDVTISGEMNANFDAHGYIVRYFNSSNDDSLLYVTDGHEHGENIPFSVTWTNNLQDSSEIRIEFTAMSDHLGSYMEIENVLVTCLPN
jgi:hypothetical protein